MPRPMSKKEAHQIVDEMADDATWDDLIHQIYVMQIVEKGQADVKKGRVASVCDVRAKYGLPECD